MTTLKEEPMPMERPASEIPLPERSTRLLGNVAIEGQPQDLCDSVLHMAIETDIQTPEAFNALLHTVVLTTIQRKNRKDGQPENRFVVNPQRVETALADYYRVFPEANTVEGLDSSDRIHTTHINTYTAQAQSHRGYREISLLLQLQADLRDKAGTQAATAAHHLLAAYGMALRPDFRAARVDLYRSKNMSHVLANERKQR